MFKITHNQSISFSIISKDNNLIHLNKKFASKFFFRRPITHGVNVVLIALNEYFKFNKKFSVITDITINFKNFILLEEFFKIKLLKNKIIIYNNMELKVEILIKKKIISKKINNPSKCRKLILRNLYYTNKYLINYDLVCHLISISELIGSVKPGNGALIYQIKTKYIKNNYNHNSKIKFRKITKNFWLLYYSSNYFHSNITTSKALVYDEKKKYIRLSKKINKLIFQKKILIIGSSGDIGSQLIKIFKKAKSYLFLYSFRISEKYPVFSKKIKTRLKRNIIKIKPDYIFYLSSTKIYHDSKNNKILKKLYEIIYYKVLNNLLKILLKHNIKSKIFYPSSFVVSNPKKFKYLTSYIYAKKKGESICNNKKYKKLAKFYRLPQFKTRSNYNLLGYYDGQNLSLISKYLNNFFIPNKYYHE